MSTAPKTVTPVATTHAPVREFPIPLKKLVAKCCDAPDLRSRQAAFVRLIRWIQGKDNLDAEMGRFAALIEYLETDEDVRFRMGSSYRQLLSELRFMGVFAETGVPSDHALAVEFLQRAIARVLPSARGDEDAAKLLAALYDSEKSVRRFWAVPPELLGRINELLCPPEAGDAWKGQREDLQEALRLLAARIAYLGLKPEMRIRGGQQGISESAFYRLAPLTDQVIRMSGEGGPEKLDEWRAVAKECREELKTIREHMESSGVSVELVFDLTKIEACLTRMEALFGVLRPATPAHQISAAHSLMGRLISGRHADRSLSNLVRENMDMLARKTVERTGVSGEHYIAHNMKEYWQMWAAAIGGGLLTVFTAAIKMRVVDAHLPPFVEGLAAGTNYAASFVLLQIFGLVLATKQPAATAATFAGIVRESRGVERSSRITDFVSHITRTQLAAAMGNVLAVAAGAVVFERIWRMMFAHSYLPEESATHVYESLHIFQSHTAFFAIITGVILWLAALAGGWCENFATYYRLHEAVAQHPIGTHIGFGWTRKVAHFLERSLGGWSTSIVLGYLLGFTPALGFFFGIPLDVRHVTLSTGTLALAAARYGTASLGDRWFLNAAMGIAVVFVLNLSVSFTIAAVVALRAYNVTAREQFQILLFLCRAAVKSPLKFILPIGDKKQEDASGPTDNPAIAAD
jgi:site-specific recombinase